MEGKHRHRKGLIGSLKEGLRKTRESFRGQLGRIFSGRSRIDPETMEELEELLVTSDLGVKTTTMFMKDLAREMKRMGEDGLQGMLDLLKEKTMQILQPREIPLEIGNRRPFVIMTVGVNGVGKTTTIAKMAKSFKEDGMEVLLVGADTFRAAATEQLEVWADRAQVGIIHQRRGADPSAVVYDALQAARNRGVDVVILDTAGRLHTKVNLMEELKKIKRVSGRVIPDAPHETLLVLDAVTGQNALAQARMFHEALGITGLAITKLDGTAKGGILVAVAAEMDVPIRFIGVGEGIDDLQVFDAKGFVEALFSE